MSEFEQKIGIATQQENTRKITIPVSGNKLSIDGHAEYEDCFMPFYPGGLMNPPGLKELDPIYSIKAGQQKKLWLEETVEEILSSFPPGQALAMKSTFGIDGPQLGIRKTAKRLISEGYFEGPMGKKAIHFTRNLINGGIQQIREAHGARLEIFYK